MRATGFWCGSSRKDRHISNARALMTRFSGIRRAKIFKRNMFGGEALRTTFPHGVTFLGVLV